MKQNNSRTFFFIQDSVTEEFYTGQNNWRSDFANGAVYYQEKNAQKKIKDIIRAWEHDQKFDYDWVKENWKDLNPDSYKENLKAAKVSDEEVAKRKSLKNWGIEIVSKKVSI
jgi:hypothetical protein